MVLRSWELAMVRPVPAPHQIEFEPDEKGETHGYAQHPGARPWRVQRDAGPAADAGTGGAAVESRPARVRRSIGAAGGDVLPALVGRERRARCVRRRQAAFPPGRPATNT